MANNIVVIIGFIISGALVFSAFKIRRLTKSLKEKIDPHLYYDVFLSYSHEDATLANAMTKALTNYGLKVWFDRNEIGIGESITNAIQEGLRVSALVLLLPSGKHKDWAQIESSVALIQTTGADILPIMTEKSSKTDGLSKKRITYTMDTNKLDFEELANVIKRHLKKKGNSEIK